MVMSLPIKSVVELAANQGMLSAMIAENPAVEKIVAIDYDEMAVDTMYKLLSQRRLSDNCVRKIFPAVADFTKMANDTLPERACGDALIALAMTHHLALSQHMRFDNIFATFRRFTKRFIFVEFMPLVLWWSGALVLPSVPQWYTEENFIASMEKHFKVLMRMQLDVNRILFVGELK